MTSDSPPRLGSSAVRTLAITGRHDPFTPAEHGTTRFAFAMPRAETLVLQVSGHFPFVAEPEIFAAAVGRWLAQGA